MANFPVQIKPPVLGTSRFAVWRILAVSILLSLALGLGWQLLAFYQTAFYPETYINGVAVGDLTLTEATQILNQTRPHPPQFYLEITAANSRVASGSNQLAAKYDYEFALTKIFEETHPSSPWSKLLSVFKSNPGYFHTPIVIDSTKNTEIVSLLANQVNVNGETPNISLVTSGITSSIKVEPGKAGEKLVEVDADKKIHAAVEQFAATWVKPESWEQFAPGSSPIEPKKIVVDLPVEATEKPLSEQQVKLAEAAAMNLVKKELKLTLENQSFYWNDQSLISLLNPDQTSQEKFLSKSLEAELEKINQALPSQPIDAEFEYDPNTLVITKFNPGKAGLKLKTDLAKTAISPILLGWLEQTNDQKTAEVKLTADRQEPNKNLAETNNLGINELVGFGESYYYHSIPSRIHNVALTAKKINLTVVKPGEEFSFNKALGEVSAATGFKPAYVIKSGRTELGDGGGVCQVSSTLFRSALNAGLNITRRLPHSYRVTYYELNSDPGFDATVYAGNVDFRFINDTPGHLLIYTETNSKNLWMKIEIYGTKDGRVATISDYKTWGAAPPPPTEYIPDASLPPGAKKQIDWSASGLKASFNYTVHDANGNLKQQETYTSIYRPWSAKYLVGPSI